MVRFRAPLQQEVAPVAVDQEAPDDLWSRHGQRPEITELGGSYPLANVGNKIDGIAQLPRNRLPDAQQTAGYPLTIAIQVNQP